MAMRLDPFPFFSKDMLIDLNQFLRTRERGKAQQVSRQWKDGITCLSSPQVYRTNPPCPPYASSIETTNETRCCVSDTDSDLRFLNAVGSIGDGLGRNLYSNIYFKPLKNAFGEDFSAWFCKNRTNIPLQTINLSATMALDNRERWFEVFLVFLFHATSIPKIREVSQNVPVSPHLLYSGVGAGNGHWNVTPDNNGKRVFSLMKKAGVIGTVVDVSNHGAADSRGHVTPLIPTALPFQNYTHTNDISGYTLPFGVTPISGYVDITNLHRVLSHAKSGYDGHLFFIYRHVAVHDSARTWTQVLGGIIRSMSRSHNIMMSVDFGFGRGGRRFPGKKCLPDFAAPFTQPEESPMHASLVAICREISTMASPRWLRVRENNATVTRWQIDDHVLANSGQPKEVVLVAIHHTDSEVKIIRSFR